MRSIISTVAILIYLFFASCVLQMSAAELGERVFETDPNRAGTISHYCLKANIDGQESEFEFYFYQIRDQKLGSISRLTFRISELKNVVSALKKFDEWRDRAAKENPPKFTKELATFNEYEWSFEWNGAAVLRGFSPYGLFFSFPSDAVTVLRVLLVSAPDIEREATARAKAAKKFRESLR